MPGEIRIEYIDLDTLKRWPRNPKAHNVETIQGSMARFGFVNPIVIDEASGRVVAGHGRIKSLVGMRDAGQEPPDRIKVRKGKWLVPVLRGVSFPNEAEAAAYLLADNQITISDGWVEKELSAFIGELIDSSGIEVLESTGFSQEDITRLLEDPKPGASAGEGVKPRSAGQIGEYEYRIIVECANEAAQREALERLETMGFTCKPLIS